MTNKKRYLGDGLHAEIKGEQLILSANDKNDMVFLDPPVLKALLTMVGEFYNDDAMTEALETGQFVAILGGTN